jgi:hypothetical protein
MEPGREDPHREEPKAPKSNTEEKLPRFRLIKLEERIAPSFNWGEVNSPDLLLK